MRSALWPHLLIADHLKEIDGFLTLSKTFAFIAHDAKGASLGFAEVSVRDYANGCTAQPVPMLEGIWVAPDGRKLGVGRALIKAVESECIARGFNEVCSDVDVENQISQQAHVNWGFEETERVVYYRKAL